MKLREKFRRFWTMDVHNHEGFTLVELIIVIAILAILSSVAVVGYSSYVTKANMQADKTLVAEIINAVTLANYDKAMPGVGSIILTEDGVEFAGDDATKAWLQSAMSDAFGSAAAGLKIQHNGWGNGAAVAKTMIDALTSDKFSTAMDGIYGDPGNLSFTEEIPELLEEIRDVATEMGGGDDQMSITMLNGAAAVTSGWDVDKICDLWTHSIEYDSTTKGYVDDANIIPAGQEANAKVTIAGLLRAKNTCLALYAAQNGFAKYYDQLATFSISDNSITPYDLTRATNQSNAEFSRLVTVLSAADPVNYANDLPELSRLLNAYKTAKDANDNLVYKNDAVAYAAMMGIVKEMASSDSLNGNSMDEYMNSVSGAANLFQKLVDGSLKLSELEASLSVSASSNNVTITFIPNKGTVVIVCSPTAIKE